MKKILPILLVAMLLTSCKKQKCYRCTFGPVAGAPQEPPRTVCIDKNEDINQQAFRDAMGNDLTATCEKR